MADEHEEKDLKNASSKTTIFVRNLPFDTNNKQLEEIFSDDAPIKQAFVVRDKDNRSKCRGFGYVQFVLQDDAEKALNSEKTFKKRRLMLCYANKKPKHEKRKRRENDQQTETANGEEEKGKEETETSTNKNSDRKEEKKTVTDKSQSIVDSAKKSNIKKTKQDIKQAKEKGSIKWTDSKTEVQRTIVVTGLTLEVNIKDVRNLCKKFGNIDHLEFPVSDRSEPTAFVRYVDYRNAIRAVQKIPGMKVKNSNVLSSVLLTKEDQRPSKKMLERSRLIVRNLNFKCEEDELLELFSKYGKVVNIHIPTKTKNNKTVKVGFAFVQFNNPMNCKVAMENMNMKEIKGRKVVLDWAVGKEEYGAEKNKQGEKPLAKGKAKENNVENESSDDEDDADNKIESDGEQEIDDVEEEEEEEIDDVAEEEEEIESESEEDEVEVQEEDSNGEMEDEIEENEEENEDTEMDDDDDDKDGSDVDEEREMRIKAKLKDAKEGKTVFVRNLSYNTEDDILEEEFEKYGEIDYCMIVYDKETGHSKGCAFVKFQEKESADKCIEEIEKLTSEEKALKIDGRSVVVSRAVTRGKIEELERTKASEKKETDRRNLYLAYEGVITSKSPGADSLSEADLKKREKALEDKKTKLKNAQYFVSRTRLCVRNIPLSCDSNELREKFFGGLGEGGEDIKITDVKIARNKERKDVSGQARSLGYGFIEVNTHEGALKLLRATNNNPDIFGPNRRPIVEFSIENSKALKILDLKRQKLERFQANGADDKEGGPGDQDIRRPSALGFSGVGKKDFTDPERRKDYKQKAKEHRYKRQLRYQKKREEKRKIRAVNRETPTSNNNVTSQQDQQQKRKTVKTSQQKTSQQKTKKVTADLPTTKSGSNSRGNHTDRTESIEEAFIQSRKRLMADADGSNDPKRSRRNKNKADEAKFTSLVAQYRNKLDSAVATGQKKNVKERWFA